MREAVILLGGAALSLAAAFTLPGESSDPLRATLVLLPLVAAALGALGAWAERRGGPGTRPAVAAAELGCLTALLLLALGRRSLGIPFATELVFAGFVLLLAERCARLVLALRPALGRHLPARPPAAFFLLPLVVYLALLPWSAARHPPDGDEPYYLLLAHSLAEDGDTDLADDYAAREWRAFMGRPLAPQPGDPEGPAGEVYSRHNALLPLVLVPGYRLAGRAGALATMAALTAALAWATLRLGRHYLPARPGAVLAAWALLALGPPLLLYSYQVWVEVPAALLVVLAVDRALGRAPASAPGQERPRGWRSWLPLALPLVLLPLLKIRFMLLALPILGLAWGRRAGAPRSRRTLLALALLLAVVGAGILAVNELRYGNPLKIHAGEELALHRQAPAAYLAGLTGLFWDCAFGLFATAPLWLLLVPALALLLVRRHPLPWHLLAVAAPYLLVVAPRREWFGGWSPPFRYGIAALPLLALALAPLLAERRRLGARALLAALGASTLVLTLLWVVVPGWTYHLADGRSDLLDQLSLSLGADIARLFPSGVRPRLATWLWPPLSALGAIALWWWPRRRGGGGRGGALGLAGLLLAAALLPWAARRLPTRTVEFEDPYLARSGGHLYPDPWIIERPRYRGGWILRQGDEARAPVAAGGEWVTVEIDVQFIRNRPTPLTMEVASGDRLLGLWEAGHPGRWETVRLEDVPWSPGEPLVVRLPGAAGDHPPNGVILDRVRLRWD